jgi:hypothetical protein
VHSRRSKHGGKVTPSSKIFSVLGITARHSDAAPPQCPFTTDAAAAIFSLLPQQIASFAAVEESVPFVLQF